MKPKRLEASHHHRGTDEPVDVLFGAPMANGRGEVTIYRTEAGKVWAMPSGTFNALYAVVSLPPLPSRAEARKRLRKLGVIP